MLKRSIQIEADTLQEARALITPQIPTGFYFLDEKVLFDGKPKIVRALGEKDDLAIAKAMSQIPDGASIISKKVLQPARTEILTIFARDEDTALAKIQRVKDDTRLIKQQTLAKPGSKGIFGFGRGMNKYEFEILYQTSVEIAYSKKATINVTVSDQLASWSALLSLMTLDNNFLESKFYAMFPHQILFVLVRGRNDDTSYFENIPFVPIRSEIIEKANQYIEHPRLPALMSAFGMTLDLNRFSYSELDKVVKLYRNDPVDQLFAQAAACLQAPKEPWKEEWRKYHSGEPPVYYPVKYAEDAIKHYASIPVLNFFFSLPYLHSVIETKRVSAADCLITVYRGIQGLFLEIYDEIKEGESVRDFHLVDKVLAILRG